MTHQCEKALFTEQQQPVTWRRFDNTDYIYICLNGQSCEDDLMEYDYKEIQASAGTIDISDVYDHPENYLDWRDDTTPTIEDLVEAINALTDLILNIGGES